MSFLKSTHFASTFAFSALLLATAATAHYQHLPNGEQNALEREALLEGFGWDVATAEVRTEKIAEGLYVQARFGGQYSSISGKVALSVVTQSGSVPEFLTKAGSLSRWNVVLIRSSSTHWHLMRTAT